MESTRNIVLNRSLSAIGIEILPEQGLLMERAGQQAVESVAEARDHEDDQRPEVVSIHQMDHDERDENHPQQGELVGSSEDLRELHARSFEACDAELRKSLPRLADFIGWRERGGRLQPGLGQETLGERGQAAVGQVEFDALDAVHGEENDGGSERLAVANHDREILERREFGAAQAQAFGSESENHSPELFARIAQGGNHEGARHKRLAGLSR